MRSRKSPRTDSAQPLWVVLLPSCPHRKYVSSHDLCLFSLLFLVITTLKSLVNLLVGAGETLLGPMRPSLLQDKQTLLPKFFSKEPSPPWWITLNSPELLHVFTAGPETGLIINLSFHGIDGSYQQTLLSAKCLSP